MKLSTMEGSLESYMRAHNEMQIKVHQQKHVSTFAFPHLHPRRTSDLSAVPATRVSSLLTGAPLSPLWWHGVINQCHAHTCDPAHLLLTSRLCMSRCEMWSLGCSWQSLANQPTKMALY